MIPCQEFCVCVCVCVYVCVYVCMCMLNIYVNTIHVFKEFAEVCFSLIVHLCCCR